MSRRELTNAGAHAFGSQRLGPSRAETDRQRAHLGRLFHGTGVTRRGHLGGVSAVALAAGLETNRIHGSVDLGCSEQLRQLIRD